MRVQLPSILTKFAVKSTSNGLRPLKFPFFHGMVPVMLGGQTYNYVDAAYSAESSTPYSLSVGQKAVKETFEVGAPVRILLGKVGE